MIEGFYFFNFLYIFDRNKEGQQQQKKYSEYKNGKTKTRKTH